MGLLASLALGAVAAGATGLFSVAGYNLLSGSPVRVLSVVLILLFVTARMMSSATATRGAAVLATLSWAAAVAVVLVRLAAAAVIPPDERDVDTWHLWPLFTMMGIGVVSGPLLVAALLVRISPRVWRRGIRILPSRLPAKLLFALTIAAAAAVALGPRVHQWVSVDACLDAGGAYDAVYDKCLFSESSGQAHMAPAAAWIDARSAGVGALISLIVLSVHVAIDLLARSTRRTGGKP